MINKNIAEAYERAFRKAKISSKRWKYAESHSAEFTDEDLEELKKEAIEDEAELKAIREQLRTSIADISDVLVRRLAEDHYLRREPIWKLAELYNYSESSIKRYLRMSRC